MKSIRYEYAANAALDTARCLSGRAEEAIEALEWVLTHDANPGFPLVKGGPVRYIIFDKAVSIRMPRIECFFEITADEIIIHDLEFS